MKRPTKHEVGAEVQTLCERLLAADPDIRDIVQFGSSVYAPGRALDVDLLVTTRKKKDYGVYNDTSRESPMGVDFVVREVGESLHRLAPAVAAFGRTVYGEGQTLEEARTEMPPPTYEMARKLFPNADEFLEAATDEADSVRRDHKYRVAFNTLFDVARNAAMAFLNTEQSRWGYLKGELPEPFRTRFDHLITTLHIEYAYNGGYPELTVDDEYRQWRRIVERFVDDLEKTSTKKEGEGKSA